MLIWQRIDKILGEQYKILTEMSSTTITTVKPGKKTTPTLTGATASPVAQRTIEGMFPAEKQVTTMNMQSVQAVLVSIQETMLKMQECMSKNHEESRKDMDEAKNAVKEDIQKLEGKIDSIQELIQKNDQRITAIEKKTEQTDDKLERLDQKMIGLNKEWESTVAMLEMEKAAFYLRFQNVKEEREEDITLVMAEMIAEALQRDKNEIINELDEVYRVHTNYARQHRLPREVHVRFVRRKVRDIVFKITKDEPMYYKQKEIITLKQVPKRVREWRKNYWFLATILNKKQIPFRWIMPEGMMVTWQGKKMKVDTQDKAQNLHDQLVGTEKTNGRRVELEGRAKEKQRQEGQEMVCEEGSIDKEEEGEIQEEEGVQTRAQKREKK